MKMTQEEVWVQFMAAMLVSSPDSSVEAVARGADLALAEYTKRVVRAPSQHTSGWHMEFRPINKPAPSTDTGN